VTFESSVQPFQAKAANAMYPLLCAKRLGLEDEWVTAAYYLA
jgi:hypothetical protein